MEGCNEFEEYLHVKQQQEKCFMSENLCGIIGEVKLQSEKKTTRTKEVFFVPTMGCCKLVE